MLTEANTVIDRKKQRKGQGIVAERNEADALFATRRKKQQEEQAEQEKREELARKKAEMEAEIQRLEEVAKRQKEQQEAAQQAAAQQAAVQQYQAATQQYQAAAQQTAAQQTQILEKIKNTVAQLVKSKSPLLYLAIGGVVFVIALIVWSLCLSRGSDLSGEEMFGTNFDRTASATVFDYNIYYPNCFEEIASENGAFFTYGSVEGGDFSYVLVSGIDTYSMESLTGSTDPIEYIKLYGELFYGTENGQVYESTTDSNRTAYSSECYLTDLSPVLSDIPEGTWTHSCLMVLEMAGGEGYLTALYGTMSDDYIVAIDQTAERFLDHIS